MATPLQAQTSIADPFGGSQPGLDAVNGAAGASTPQSQNNAASQKKVTSNPFSDALAGASTWAPLNLGGDATATTSAASNPFATVYGQPQPVSTAPEVTPPDPTGGGTWNPDWGTGGGLHTTWSSVTPQPSPWSATPQSTPAPGGSATTNGLQASTDRSRPSETPTDPLYAKLYEYAATPGYEYLKDKPDLLRGYYQYVDDLRTRLKEVGFDGSQADRLDFVDYLAHHGQPSPLAGRSPGGDTWMDMPAPLTPNVVQSGGSGGYKITTVGDPNQGVDPAIQGLVSSYINSDPRYGWLAQSPVAVQEYQTWANQTGNTDTDLVDWLKHQPAYAGKENPLGYAGDKSPGRNGYDTFLYKKDANGLLVPRTGTATPDPNAPPGTTVTPSGGSGGYITTGPAPTPPPTAPPVATPPPTPPPTAPPVATPPPTTTPTAPPVATPAPTTTPAATTPNAEIQSLVDLFRNEYQNQQPDIESMLNPMFARQRMNMLGDLNAEGAATGAIKSGGFGQTKGEAIADLSGKQSASLADYTSKQSLAQMEQNTALAQLSTTAGMQGFLAEMNDKLQRDNVQTNADLQKWLNSADNTLKAKGIDAQAVWEKYQADIGLQGKQVDAQAQIDAAKFHEAAASVAANTQARASMANAQLQRQTAIDQLGVARENNIGQFILGLLGLSAGGAAGLGDILNKLPPGLIVTTP